MPRPNAVASKAQLRSNDGTIRDRLWWRYAGDEWTAFEALPLTVRRRLHEHAYDAWSVNALMLWRRYRRSHPTQERAERALLRYMDYCERLERAAFAVEYERRHGGVFPHDAACLPVLRYKGLERPFPRQCDITVPRCAA